jgi:hypothetical protein
LALRQQAEIALSEIFEINGSKPCAQPPMRSHSPAAWNYYPPLTIEVSSPTLKRQRLEQMQRAVSQRQTADRVEDFQRTAELLKQWDSLRSSSPSITPGQLLQQLNPADRGSMLEMLLMASAGQHSQLWSVAGPNLVQIDFKNDAAQPRLIELPTTAGPLRSVQVMNDKVLVGARNGVFIIDPANSNQTERLSRSRTDFRLRLFRCELLVLTASGPPIATAESSPGAPAKWIDRHGAFAPTN